ncbi:MAG: glycosyltransferase family 2 protein [Euzebyales bacterium]|nr:glycosyltransferase family 2 protein [Euzebyales bacterium]
MSAEPTVSVVVPTRNRVDMLQQTLRTILAQDALLEVIVVDEGSTDGTQETLRGWRDPRLRLVRHDTPQGLPAARNAGIARCGGAVIGFCDDDDLWLPDKLTLQLAAMRAAASPWAFGGAMTFSDGPRLLHLTPPPTPTRAVERLPWENTVPGGGSNAIVAADVLREVGGFDPMLRSLEDWDLWIRLAQVATPAVVDRPLIAYREHGGNMSRKIPTMMDSARILDERYATLRDGEPLDWVGLHRWLAQMVLRSGDRRGAIGLHLSAVRARHPGALRRLLRSLVPIPPRPPVASAENATGWIERFRPRQVVPWPEGAEEWLGEVLGAP